MDYVWTDRTACRYDTHAGLMWGSSTRKTFVSVVPASASLATLELAFDDVKMNCSSWPAHSYPYDFHLRSKRVKLSHYKPCRSWQEIGYSSYSLLTSALDGVSGQRHAPSVLYPREKDPRYPLDRRVSGLQTRSGHRGYKKNPLPLPGIGPRSPGGPVHSQTLY
jgi:hypothetical protein